MADLLNRFEPSQAFWPTLAHLIRLNNQAGTMLLMLPTMWALVLASRGVPRPSLVAIFAVGSFLMRSAGVIMNDLADRSLDRLVERTRSRPLASGALGAPTAIATATILILLAAGLLVFLNRLALLLSPVAVLLAAAYPFAKRFVQLPQMVLGVAFGWGVIMAWAAVRNSVEPQAWLLFAGTVCWAVGYDTIYALQDREDDARVGIKSAAILFGARTWIAVGISLGGMLLLLMLAGWLAGLGPGFYLSLVGVGAVLISQVRKLRSQVPPAVAFALFKQHIWIGWAILAGFGTGFL